MFSVFGFGIAVVVVVPPRVVVAIELFCVRSSSIAGISAMPISIPILHFLSPPFFSLVHIAVCGYATQFLFIAKEIVDR